MYYPSITCLCPTYGRPKLLANAIACFQAQDYPRDRMRLVVVDDLGTIRHIHSGVHNVILHVRLPRFASLPEKYNAAIKCAPESDVYVVWEDDDTQLPWCIRSHAMACILHGWSHPSHVWSDYGNVLHTEPVGGRFHGSLAITGKVLREMGGWVQTRRADFDLQMIAALRQTGEPGDPCNFAPAMTSNCRSLLDAKGIESGVWAGAVGMSPYVFRWHTEHAHGQSGMKSPDDETWYDNYEPPDRSGPHDIVPGFDHATQQIYNMLTC